jgi:hypothetical protein
VTTLHEFSGTQVRRLSREGANPKSYPKSSPSNGGTASLHDTQHTVRNKPVARASTGRITFGRGPAARVAVVSVSELSPCPGRAAIEQLAPVYACVMGVCLQLTAYAAWWSCMESVAIRRELQARPARWCASLGRPKLADQAAEWGSVSSCSRSAALAIKTPCTHRCRRGQEKYKRQHLGVTLVSATVYLLLPLFAV